MEIASWDKYIIEGKEKNKLPSMTMLNISSTYQPAQQIDQTIGDGDISGKKVDFTPFSLISYDSANPLGQVISINATDTLLTGGSFTVYLSRDILVKLLIDVFFQLTGANTAANISFFFQIDGINRKAKIYDFGQNTGGLNYGISNPSSRMAHDLLIMKQGMHTIKVMGRYDQTVSTPNLAVNYFHFTYLPLGN